MGCKAKTAQVLNTMLLAMGGYSFGRDVAIYFLGRDNDMMLTHLGLVGSLLFFLYSLLIRRFVDESK